MKHIIYTHAICTDTHGMSLLWCLSCDQLMLVTDLATYHESRVDVVLDNAGVETCIVVLRFTPVVSELVTAATQALLALAQSTRCVASMCVLHVHVCEYGLVLQVVWSTTSGADVLSCWCSTVSM